MAVDPSALEGIEFFNLLGEDERRALSEVVDLIRLDENQTLFRAGEPGESLFIVRSGEIELFIKDTAGQKIVLDTARAGDFFGELALLDAAPRSATATALMSSELIELDRDDLLLLFQKKPESALSMLAAMGRMTRKADELLQKRVSRNVNEEVEEKLTTVQRIADWLAWFSGSMPFLFLHTIWFAVWIVLNVGVLNIPRVSGFDPFPFGLLTMIVSLEAIFLSTFVMISQNRADAKRQVIADEQWKTVQIEDQQNEELLKLSKQILQLTQEVRSFADRFAGDTRHH